MNCSRCGICCTYELNNQTKTCQYLIGKIGTYTTCSIYENRIGTIIDKEQLNKATVRKVICGYRKYQKRNIPGCTEMDSLKILVGISIINSVHPTFLKSLENSRHEWKMQNLFTEILWDDHVPLDFSRNIVVKNALYSNSDYIFFLDSDIQLPVNTLKKLIEHNKDIITGIYYWKSNPWIPIISKYDNDKIGYNPIIDFDSEKDNPIEIDGTGFGCCLIKTDVFRKIQNQYPWFRNEWIYPENREPFVLEGDLNCCKLLQHKGYKIYADNTIICPHWGTYVTKKLVQNDSKSHLGGSLKNGEQPVELIKYLVNKYNSKSVLDVGCGAFGAIKIFNSFGIENIWGLDGDSTILFRKDISQQYLDRLTIQDLEISSYKYPEKFDMVFSYETAEHISNVENYIDTITDNCKNILVITHGLPGQNGYHHVNNQNDKYWINLITTKGFEYLENDTLEARQFVKEDRYFKQSGLIFKRKSGT